jgi:hypothetical protein
MRVSFDLIKYKIIPNITDPFDLLELSHTCRTLRDFIHSIERKCPNPDCENKNCSYGGFQVFLILLNIVAGIEPIDYSKTYHKCLVYQLRFILFPYKKKFTLSFKARRYQEEPNKYIEGYGWMPPSTFPTVGTAEDHERFLNFEKIMDRGTPNEERNNLWRIFVFEPLKLMQNISDLWSGEEHKDEYKKGMFISGVWHCDRYGIVDLKIN